MTTGPWWHAFGRVRLLPVPGEEPAEIWQLTVVSPSGLPPAEMAERAPGFTAWGDYLASWDHEPSDAEKDAVTPEPFRDDPTDPT